jgi:hypothetical protein
MNTTLFITLLSLASITFSVKAVGETLNCATYSGGTKGFGRFFISFAAGFPISYDRG